MTRERHDCCDQINPVRRGLWSPEEDARLSDFINTHEKGSWNWSNISRRAGLQRCGKSCRFRWTNYLDPELKRGNWSDSEFDLIVNLHKQYGNKWSRIAEFLPGRTSNDIKNLWTTRIKKKVAQGGNPNFTAPYDPPNPSFFDGVDQFFPQQAAIGGGGNDPVAPMVAIGGDPAAAMVVDGGGDALLEKLLMGSSSSSGEIPPPSAPPAGFFDGLGF